jgi:hypothetical protein
LGEGIDIRYKNMMNSKQIFAVSLLLFVAQSSLGQEPGMSSPYSFGGACASQGVWTQTALSATQNLRKVALQLRDDPNCRAMGTSMQASIQNLESAINRASDSPARVARLSQLPQEIGALRSFLTSAPDLKQQVLRVMMDKSIESATLSAQVGQEVPGESSHCIRSIDCFAGRDRPRRWFRILR